ncbi:MAG TPA: TonB-dependent receptor plug domain-containing protein, partial [Cytophagales bacterium]|nr:TonB-dependent receptor plug domain-containing protein [Cytophagales bacterium]
MLRTNLLQWLLTTSATLLVGQPIDSTVILEPVIIKLYPSERPSYFSPSSISAIGPEVLDKQSPGSLLPSLNTVAGVRMEERSPGSYRVSIRGSLLRAPFGVRNIKVYLDAFPLTDAGGNTYLNILDPAAIKRIEILKGPEGSIYGANTGGVLQLSPWQAGPKSSQGHAGISGGSYGLLMQHMDYEQHKAKTSFKIFQGIQKAEGYRRNSAMSRYFLQGLFTYHLDEKSRLKLLGMYSDLRYATPGGLTEAQADT